MRWCDVRWCDVRWCGFPLLYPREIPRTVDLTIRDATVDDAEGIARILNQAIESRAHTVFSRPFTVDEERALIASFPPRGIFT